MAVSAAAVLSLALAGCSAESGADTATTTDGSAAAAATGITGVKPAAGCPAPASITIWSNLESASQQDMERAEAAAFAQTCPGADIAYSYYKSADLKQKLTAVMSSGTPPTLFESFGGAQLDQYADAGKVLDLDKVLSAADSGWKDKLVPVTLNTGEHDGGVYGFPVTGPQSVMVFYNKQVFEKAGVTPPKTMSEFEKAVATFKQAGIAPIAVGNTDLWPSVVQWELNLDRAAGSDPLTAIEDGRSGAWSDPAVLASLEQLQQQGQDGTFEPAFNSVSVTNGSAAALLYTGRAAMEVSPPFLFDQITSGDPSFIADGDLGYFAYPTADDGTGANDVVGNAAGMYAMTSSATKAQQQLAAAYMTSQLLTVDYAKRQAATGLIPALDGVADEIPNDAAGKVNRFSYELGENADVVIPQLNDSLGTDGSTLMTLTSNVMDSTATPRDLITAMQKTTK